MNSAMASTQSSSAKNNNNGKPFAHVRQSPIKRTTVHPTPTVATDEHASKSSALSSEINHTFEYMIMMKSAKNVQNNSIFKKHTWKYNDEELIENVVLNIIKKSVEDEQTKSSSIDIAIVLDNKIVSDHQKSIHSLLMGQSSPVLYILVVRSQQKNIQTNDGSSAASHQMLTSSSIFHSFEDKDFIFVYYTGNEQRPSAQVKQSATRFLVLQDVQSESTLESIRDKAKKTATYNCLLKSFPATEDGMKSLFDDIKHQYLKPLETAIQTKIIVPELNKWKLIPWRQVFITIGIIVGVTLALPIVGVIAIWRHTNNTNSNEKNVKQGLIALKIMGSTLLAVMSPLFYINYFAIAVYQYFLSEMNYWNIVFLEAYWPFMLHWHAILMIGIVLFYYCVSKTEKSKQTVVERCYEDARSDFYEKNAVSIGTTRIESSDDFQCSCTGCVLPGVGIGFYLIVTSFHVLIPELIRQFGSNIELNTSPTLNYTGLPWYGRFVEASYLGAGTVYNLFFFAMILLAWITYINLAGKVDKIMASVTNNDRFIEQKTGAYYDLRKPGNLDYFISQFKQEVANTDPFGYCLATITYAFFIDALLIIIAVYRLFFVSVSVNVLTVLLLIDIIVLSLPIIGFLIIVAYINQRITIDAQQLIKRTITETTMKLIDIKSIKKKTDAVDNEQESLENGIAYLSAMSDFIENEKKRYCICLFFFLVVDMDMVRKTAVSIVTGIAASLFTLIKGKSLLA
ncbi:unnamed protein product [Adineta steineri]|uniref:Uncharacterized protein n=1 Tax=Adineta steineri TaxID=433720 RepID=A0A814ILY3_9BILA|nr:unnamed protein product [Adineta steineri]